MRHWGAIHIPAYCFVHVYYGVSYLRATLPVIYFKIHPDDVVKSLWIRYFSRVAANHFLMDGLHCLTQCLTQCHTVHYIFTRSCYTLMDGVQSFEDLYGAGQYKSPSGVLNEYLSKQVSTFHESLLSTIENFKGIVRHRRLSSYVCLDLEFRIIFGRHHPFGHHPYIDNDDLIVTGSGSCVPRGGGCTTR